MSQLHFAMIAVPESDVHMRLCHDTHTMRISQHQASLIFAAYLICQ